MIDPLVVDIGVGCHSVYLVVKYNHVIEDVMPLS